MTPAIEKCKTAKEAQDLLDKTTTAFKSWTKAAKAWIALAVAREEIEAISGPQEPADSPAGDSGSAAESGTEGAASTADGSDAEAPVIDWDGIRKAVGKIKTQASITAYCERAGRGWNTPADFAQLNLIRDARIAEIKIGK